MRAEVAKFFAKYFADILWKIYQFSSELFVAGIAMFYMALYSSSVVVSSGWASQFCFAELFCGFSLPAASALVFPQTFGSAFTVSSFNLPFHKLQPFSVVSLPAAAMFNLLFSCLAD